MSADLALLAVSKGDFSQLTDEQKVSHYTATCESLGLILASMPLTWQTDDNGCLKLAVNKNGADQLRNIHGISITGMVKEFVEGMVIVTVTGKRKDGREDIATGVRSLTGVQGIEKANAIMGAETAAKRRLTISLSGAGLPDASDAVAPAAQQSSLPRSTEVPQPIVVPTVNQTPAEEVVDERPNFGTVPFSPAPTPEQLDAQKVVLPAGPEPEPLTKLAAAVAHQPHTEHSWRDNEPPPHTDADQPSFFGEVNFSPAPTSHVIVGVEKIRDAQPDPGPSRVSYAAQGLEKKSGNPFLDGAATPVTPNTDDAGTQTARLVQQLVPEPTDQPRIPTTPFPPASTDEKPTQIAFREFTGRCTRLVRDVLQKEGKEGKEASTLVLPFIQKMTGKKTTADLTVAEWNAVHAKFDGAGSVKELIKLLKGAK